MTNQSLFRRRTAGAPAEHAPGEQGQALVEAALTLPIICAFMFTMIEICLLFYSYCMISESARQGTRYAIVHGTSCQTAASTSCTTTTAAINSYVQNLGWPNLGGGTLTANTTLGSGDLAPSHTVTVTVSYSFPVNLPFVPQGSVGLNSSSTMMILQ